MNLRYTLNNATEGEHITTYSPKGWEDTELVLKRHERYDGIFKDYVVKAEFFCGAGKEYLDNIEETQGVEAVVTILIEIDCDDSGTYQNLYTGVIMFDTFETTSAAPQFTRVNIKQDDIVQTILSRLETKVNISSLETIDGTALTPLDFASYDISLHSKAVTYEGEFNFIGDETVYTGVPAGWTLEGSVTDGPITVTDSPGVERTIQHSFSQTIIGEIPVFNEVTDYTGDSNTLASSDTYPGDTSQIQTESLIEIVNTGTDTYNISGQFSFGFKLDMQISSSATTGTKYFDYTVTPRLYLQVGSTITLLDVKATVTGSTNFDSESLASQNIIPFTDYTFEFNETGLTGNDGEFIRLYVKFDEEWVIERPGLGGSFELSIIKQCFINEDFSIDELSVINISQESVTEDTTATGGAIFETGAQIARVISDQADAFRSEFFGRVNSEPYQYESNGCGSFNAITNGFQIRGFPVESSLGVQGRPVYMSMKEYFEGLSAMFCLGLGVKQDGDNTYLEVEPKEHFYTDEVLFNLSNIKSLISRVDKTYFYNKVKIGFSEWRKSEGSTNGLDEFCTLQEYATLNKNVSKTLDAISDLVAAPYAIELTRRKQYSETVSEDTDFDDKNFIIALNRSTDYGGTPDSLDIAEKDENFTNISNVFSPETIYNLRFKPVRLLSNWYKIIGTSLIKLNDTLKTIKFTFGEGNYKIISQGTEVCDPAKMNLMEAGEDIEIIIPGPDGLEPLFTGHVDEFESPFDLALHQLLKELDINGNPNYYKKIGYSTTESDYLNGYILECRYKPIRGKASFKMARAYERSTECSHIYVEEGYVDCEYVN
jgi:hypothetical protein